MNDRDAVRCKEIWERCANALDALEQIALAFPECECENFSLSDHSPGTVSDLEFLIRILFLPVHFDDATKRLSPGAYDDVHKRGLSVNRRTHITPRELRRLANQMISRSKKSGRGIAKTGYLLAIANCADIRRLRFSDGGRMCCVLDTAGKANRSHADVAYSKFRKGNISRSKREELAEELSSLFRIVGVDEIF